MILSGLVLCDNETDFHVNLLIIITIPVKYNIIASKHNLIQYASSNFVAVLKLVN